MKIRKGFVSNSSSSSFICDVCGEDASGWDLCLTDAGMYECVHGHIFCDEHADLGDLDDRSFEEKKAMLLESYLTGSGWEDEKKQLKSCKTEEDFEESDVCGIWEDFKSEFRHEVPAEACPICMFKVLQRGDFERYHFKKTGTTDKDALAMIKDEFGTYKKFKEFLKEE